MRYPSVKTLGQICSGKSSHQGISESKLVRELLDGTRKITVDLAPRRKSCYHPPKKFEMKLTAISEVIGGCGVEAIADPKDELKALYHYINMGDMYVPTLVWNGNNYRVCCLADLLEK